MVLMLSGAASPGERADGLGLGDNAYLVKPFDFPELVMRVRALARRRPQALPRVLRVAGWSSTACPASPGATAVRYRSQRRSWLCWRRSWPPRPAT